MTFRNKFLIFLASFIIFGLVAASSLAQINVKSDLSNAVQNIQKVYFSPDGVRNPDPNKNILVELQNGVVKIHGKVLIEKPGGENQIVSDASGAILIMGKENKIYGMNDIILGGTNNEIEKNATNAGIFGGRDNKIHSGEKNFIFWGTDNRIVGTQSVIMWGQHNRILSGKNNYLLAGSDKTIQGTNNIVAGKNIKFKEPRNDVFAWSDSYPDHDIPTFSPAMDKVFLVRAANGIGINTPEPKVHGIDVADGTFQISDQPWLACDDTTNGAMKFKKGDNNQAGCFCYCNGKTWTPMTPSNRCAQDCKN